jgi:lysyl-tRNA synthetase class 1
MVVSFAMLLNLASVAGAKDKSGLWGFIRAMRRMPRPRRTRSGSGGGFACAISATRWRPPGLPPAHGQGARGDRGSARPRLWGWDGGLDDEALQTMVFAVGKEHGFEPLRDWFKALYEVLLGASVRARALAGSSRFMASRKRSR